MQKELGFLVLPLNIIQNRCSGSLVSLIWVKKGAKRSTPRRLYEKGFNFTAMATFTKANFTKGGAMGVEFTITLSMEDMKETGLMEDTMDME